MSVLLGRWEDGGIVEDNTHDEHGDAPPDASEHSLRPVLVLHAKKFTFKKRRSHEIKIDCTHANRDFSRADDLAPSPLSLPPPSPVSKLDRRHTKD